MANETILVVEDEVLVGEEIREDLEGFGYRVPEIISSGEAVAEAVDRIQPALVLMDIRIGGTIDGIDAAAKIRERADIPIIYLTAFSDQETLARAADTEPAAYLLKPFSGRELKANVAMALSKARSGIDDFRRSEPFLEVLDLPGFLLDDQGRIRFANVPALRLLGHTDATAVRGSLFSAFFREMRPGSDRLVVRSAGGMEREVFARSEPIDLIGSRTKGSLVIIDSMNSKERRYLETSAGAANEALNALLPVADAAGLEYVVAGFLLPNPTGSGDMYDVFPLGDDRFAFYALDVMGNGMLPSLFAFSLHDVIRLLACRPDGDYPGPAALVEAINARYTVGTGSAPFFSLVYGEIERKTGDYRYVRAGHPPLIHVPRIGTARVGHAGGPALGAFAGIRFEEGSGKLEPGERLIICSDGLLQGEEGDTQKGLEAFLRIAEIGRSLEARVFAASVKAAALGKTGTEFSRDDASMLVLERRTLDAL